MVRVTKVKRQSQKYPIGETNLSGLNLNTVSPADSKSKRAGKEVNQLLSSQSTTNPFDSSATLSTVQQRERDLTFNSLTTSNESLSKVELIDL